MNLYNETQNTRAHEAIVNYFQQLADPLNHQPGPIPDSVCIPFALKSISYAKSLSIPTSANGLNGMFIFIPGSDRPTIRHYGYDPLVGRNNLIEVILPTEEIGDNYDYYRHVQTGLFLVANTVNGGAFAVQGVLNAIAFGSLFPVRSTPPEAISQYKDTNYNVISSVPVSDGVVAIPPLTDEFKFKRLRGTNLRTPVSSTGDIATFYSEQAQELGNFHFRPPIVKNISIPAGGNTITLIEILMPEPAPWGAVEITGNILLQGFSSAVPIYAEVIIYRASANTVNYAEQILNVESFISVMSAANLAGGGIQATFPICYKGPYLDQEIVKIVITVRQFTGAPVTCTLHPESDITIQLNDDYILAQRGSGVAISYQSLTEIQVSIAGKSTFELIPNAALSRNLPVGYNVEVPGVAEIARDSYIRQLGNPLRCVYTAQEYANIASKYVQRQTSEDIAIRAGTISRALYNALSNAAPFLIRGAGAAVGGFTGNPMLGRAVGSIGMGLYSGMTGQGKNAIMQNSSVKQSDVMRSSTMEDKFAMMMARMDQLEAENAALKKGLSATKVQTTHLPIAPIKPAYDLNTWDGRAKQALLIYQQNINKYNEYKGFAPHEHKILVLPTIGLAKFDPIAAVRNTDWAQGTYSNVSNEFSTKGAIYTKFVGVLSGTAYDGAIVASTKPLVDLLNSSASYEQVGAYMIDTRISRDTWIQNAAQKQTPLHQLTPGESIYITITYNGTIEGVTQGTSWHLSFWALLYVLPPTSYYTGSVTESLDPNDLLVKMEHAAKTNTKIYIATNFNDQDIDYEPVIESEYFVTLREVMSRGPANFIAIGFNNTDANAWYMIVAVVMLVTLTGATKIKELSNLSYQESGLKTNVGSKPYGRFASQQDFEEKIILGKPGPYKEYVTSLGKQGELWLQAVIKQEKFDNYDKLKKLFDQAEPWMNKRARAPPEREVSKKKSAPPKSKNLFEILKAQKQKQSSSSLSDDAGFD